MNNEIKLKNGAVIKLIDKDITGEQHMDVKKTYVATTKKEIVAKGIKYYQDKLNSVVMDKPEVESIDITPIMNVPTTEVPPVVEEAVSSQLSEVDNTIPNAVEEAKDEMPTVEEITKQAPLYTEEPVKAEIESVPETPTTLEQDTPYSVPTEEQPTSTPLAEEPFFNTMNITLPSEGLTSAQMSAPTPEPIINTSVDTPNPFSSINVEAETPTVEPISLGNQEPVVFDASKENNLLNALSDKTVEASNKAMLLNNDSLNNVRDFGEEPAKVNYQPNVRKAGFVNSKLLTVISILFFLASCGFLVYEIFNFINAKK